MDHLPTIYFILENPLYKDFYISWFFNSKVINKILGKNNINSCRFSTILSCLTLEKLKFILIREVKRISKQYPKKEKWIDQRKKIDKTQKSLGLYPFNFYSINHIPKDFLRNSNLWESRGLVKIFANWCSVETNSREMTLS